MKKFVIALMICFLSFSCSKKREVTNLNYGVIRSHLTSYIKTFLAGKFKISEQFFQQTEKDLILSDDYCNLSRIYLKKFFLEEELSNNSEQFLKMAIRYASINNCREEISIAQLLLSNKTDVAINDTFYKEFANYLNGDSKTFVKYIEKGELPAYAKSKLFRLIATDTYHKEPSFAKNLLNKAYLIDKQYGYTVYLLLDLKKMYEICKYERGENCKSIHIKILNIEKLLKK